MRRALRRIGFDKAANWDYNSEQASSEFIIDYMLVSDPTIVIVHQEVQEGARDQDSMSPLPSLAAVPQDIKSPPSSPVSGQLDAYHDDALVHYRSIRDIMAAMAPGEQTDDQGDDLLVVNTEELASFQEAQPYDC
jgi:hypothetical protein